ncbi:MAG: hypothetical protein BMS9Abin23_0998 [Thermodesulfobacteriota bacterium]|nr:MAG: hypothetical protein BMS9Abin23_0998 [Thermodesulfobacteriota bacterium]
MKKGIKKNLLLMAVVVMGGYILSGCGYYIAGKGGVMPGGVTSVAIPVFVNRTRKPNIESIITNKFASEFVTTVDVRDDAEAELRGVIKTYELRPVSYTKNDVVQEYRLSVTLALSLVDNNGGEVLWEDGDVRDYEDFIVNSTDVTATEEAEITVFKKLSKDLARLVKERMLENF